MPLTIAGIIAWIVANPQIIAEGEAAIVAAVQAAISLWQQWQAGSKSTAELQAEWAAMQGDFRGWLDGWKAAAHPPAAS